MQTKNWLLRLKGSAAEPKTKKEIKISAGGKCLINLAWCLAGVNEVFTNYIKKKRDI